MYNFFFLNNNRSCTAAKAAIRGRGGGMRGGVEGGRCGGGWQRGHAGPGTICN